MTRRDEGESSDEGWPGGSLTHERRHPDQEPEGLSGDEPAELSDDEPAELSDDEQAEVLAGEPVRVPIEPTLDLHSFLPAEVASVVEEYLQEAVRAGFGEVRIIHGRGIGVQRETVRTILARSDYVISFRDAPPALGGWGATLAALRR